MMRPKNKFYQMSQREKEGEKINDIYKLISQQQQTMAQLLSKYQDKNDRQYSYQKESRTIQPKSFHQTTPIQRGKSPNKIQQIVMQLPSISPNRKINKKRQTNKSKDKLSDLNPYFVDLKSEKEKIHLKNHLERAYGTERLKNHRSRSRVEPNQKQPELVKKNQSERTPNVRQESRSTAKQKQPQNTLPTPLGYLRQNVDNDSSSQEGQVPLNYYERQFRTAIRSQCLQQTNFLYFSKNQSIKDWTEGLLLLFEKHDKQLQSLRKKCRYLQKFDDNFFSIDIFKDA